MGDFILRIEAAGGHGCDRKAGVGERIAYAGVVDGSASELESVKRHLRYCPDCAFKVFVEQLAASGLQVKSAEETHWPDSEHQVVDDVLNARRVSGAFHG